MSCGKKLIVAALVMVTTILAMAPRTDAGPVGGPKYSLHRVQARSTDVFNVTFYGAQSAVIVIDGDGDTDLDLCVYDENRSFR